MLNDEQHKHITTMKTSSIKTPANITLLARMSGNDVLVDAFVDNTSTISGSIYKISDMDAFLASSKIPSFNPGCTKIGEVDMKTSEFDLVYTDQEDMMNFAVYRKTLRANNIGLPSAA